MKTSPAGGQTPHRRGRVVPFWENSKKEKVFKTSPDEGKPFAAAKNQD